MQRIRRKFRALRSAGRKAFIPYIMAGDPSLERTREAVLLMERCGADIIELGVPFTDPLADGPTIQRAAERALAAGVNLHAVIGLVGELRRETEVPIVLMTYYNPVLRYGEERFVADAVKAGADGVIIPDLPPDEAAGLIRLSRRAGLDTIFLLAPTSTDERVRKVAKATRGFLYYVPITGITGARLSLDDTIGAALARIRRFTGVPISVGFGVSNPAEAAVIANVADGVIVGSAIVRTMHESPGRLHGFLRELRSAIDEPRGEGHGVV